LFDNKLTFGGRASSPQRWNPLQGTPFRLLPRRDNQREEHIVLALEGERAVGPQVGDLASTVAHLLRGPVDLQMYFHGNLIPL
jgi:hypothetical protein